MPSVCRFYIKHWLRELYVTDFRKPDVYRSERASTNNAWTWFRRKPSRVGRGRGAEVFLVVCFFMRRGFVWLFFHYFYFERTQPTACAGKPCLIYVSTVINSQEVEWTDGRMDGGWSKSKVNESNGRRVGDCYCFLRRHCWYSCRSCCRCLLEIGRPVPCDDVIMMSIEASAYRTFLRSQ